MYIVLYTICLDLMYDYCLNNHMNKKNSKKIIFVKSNNFKEQNISSIFFNITYNSYNYTSFYSVIKVLHIFSLQQANIFADCFEHILFVLDA